MSSATPLMNRRSDGPSVKRSSLVDANATWNDRTWKDGRKHGETTIEGGSPGGPSRKRTMHREVKTLSVKENQSSFISYLLKDGRDGNITDIAVNEFWTRVAMHSLKGTKKVKVMCQGNCGIGRPLLLEEMRASEAEHAHMAGDTAAGF
jgi:hypothetical protein